MQNKIRFRQFLPAIIWFLLVCILVFMPGNDVPQIGWMKNLPIDKAVHLILFGVLFLLFMIPVWKSSLCRKKKQRWLIIIAFSVSLWGIITEIIQHYYIAGRTFDLWDWVADTTGVLVSIYIVLFLMSTIGGNQKQT